jgi:integrase
VGEYLAYWLDVTRRRVHVSIYEAYALAARRLDPYIGRERLSRLDAATIQATSDGLSEMGLSARSVKQVHAVLHRALDQAIHWGLTSRNPTEVVTPPRPAKREMTALTRKQFGRLLASSRDDHWYPLCVLLGTAGLRIGEALGLRWDDVDLAARRLAVRRALQRQQAAGLVFIPPKTRSRRRSVRLSRLACGALAGHRENRRGGPMESSSVTSALDRALRLAGLPRIRVHDLRHTAASVLLEAGAHPKVVQDCSATARCC